MRRRPRRSIILLAVLGLAATAGYAFASTGGGDLYGLRVSCIAGRFVSARGNAPASARAAYLVFRNGASITATLVAHRYTFMLPSSSPLGHPSLLRFVDGVGGARDVSLDDHAFVACPAPAVRHPTAPVALAARRPRTVEDQAGALVNQARQAAMKTSKDCGNQLIPPPRLTLSNGTPSRAILDVLGVLRRSPTPEDLALGAAHTHGPPIDDQGVLTIFERYARVIHEPGGHTAQIVVGVGQVSLSKSELYPCINAATAILRRLLPGHPRAVQREALRIQLSYKLGPQTHGVHPWLDYDSGGGTTGPFDVHRFKRFGIIIEGGSAHPSQFEWDLNGLVPDGVASITLRLTGQARRTPLFGRPSNYYKLHPASVTQRVTENAFFLELPSDPTSAAHQIVIWRDPQGHVIRKFSFL
jgi:hypothetical protein